MYSIEINNISKKYGTIKAIENISIEIPNGELFGFIGPDGAGKTTLFRILATLLLPDTGYARLNGLDAVKDYKKIRNILGYMPGRFSLYQDLTVEENLSFFATIFGTTIKENYNLIKDIYIQIEPFKNRRAGALSGGMKQKLALCCAMIHKPEILILDEPTTGVDAVSRKEFWEMLKNLKLSGITILVSTPYMDEASMCDRIALMQNGKIMKINKPSHITDDFGKILFGIKSDNMFKLISDLNIMPQQNSVYPFGQYIHFTSANPKLTCDDIKNYLIKDNKHDYAEVKIIKPNIEDVFMELMGAEGKGLGAKGKEHGVKSKEHGVKSKEHGVKG